MSFNEYNGNSKNNFNNPPESQPNMTVGPINIQYSLSVEEMYYGKTNDKIFKNMNNSLAPTVQKNLVELPTLSLSAGINSGNQTPNLSNSRTINPNDKDKSPRNYNNEGYNSSITSKQQETLVMTPRMPYTPSDAKTVRTLSIPELYKNLQQEYYYYNILIHFTTAFMTIYAYYFFIYFALSIIIYGGYFSDAALDTQIQLEQGSYSLKIYIFICSLGFLRAIANIAFLIIGIKAYDKLILKSNKIAVKFFEITLFFGLMGLAVSMFSGLADVLYCLFTLACFFVLYKSAEGFTRKLEELDKLANPI